MEASALTKLPLEVRQIIWQYVLCPKDAIHLWPEASGLGYRARRPAPNFLALLSTCRQIRLEGEPFFWSRNVFRLEMHRFNSKVGRESAVAWSPHVYRWMQDIGEKPRLLLRRLVLGLHWAWIPEYSDSRDGMVAELAKLNGDISERCPRLSLRINVSTPYGDVGGQYHCCFEMSLLSINEAHESIPALMKASVVATQGLEAERIWSKAREQSIAKLVDLLTTVKGYCRDAEDSD